MTLEPLLHKYLKLKIHHLSYYLVQLYGQSMVITFVMENFADTSDNKRSKVTSTCRLTIDNQKKKYEHCLHIKGKPATTFTEPCSEIWFNELYNKVANNIDGILATNKNLEELKESKKRSKKSYEQKLMFKREKKRLEGEKSVYRDRLKTILKELFETG